MAGPQFQAQLSDHTALAQPEVAALFGDRGEGVEFLQALGRGNLVEMKSVVVRYGSVPVAAGSQMWFPFDLVAEQPKLQPTVRALRKVRAPFAYLRLSGLGALHTGEPPVVISSKLDPQARDAAFGAMLDVAEAEADRRRAHYHFFMDMSHEDALWSGPLLRSRGYFPMEGTPMTWQYLPYSSIDEFIASRSQKLRYQMRKQFARARAEIEVVETSTIDDALEVEIETLAQSMQQHARHSLGGAELMPPGFYRRLAETRKAIILLYKLNGRIVGFAFMLEEDDVLYGKALGLSWPEASDYHLIHYNIFKGIETAIRRGKRWAITGQGGYPTKLLFGAKLVRRTSFLKGRGLHGVFLPMFANRLDGFNPARQWKEVTDPTRYFDADTSGPQPPVKRIWTPEA